MATLYVVATPIGNLQDITLRAVSVLSNVDLILAEDTRVSQVLLAKYNIQKPIISYHQHSSIHKIEQVIEQLREGKNLALVSDAGTPGINDPGGYLISQILQALPETKIVPIPGPNAAISALSISGFPSDRFKYLGFVPHKKGRQTFFREAAADDETLVFYESKHRILKTLAELAAALEAAKSARQVMVARELTKQFETIYRGSAQEILTELEHNKNILGEFVVVISPPLRIKHKSDEK